MKILTLNYEYPPLGGGAGLIARKICEGLVRLGHSVSVITTGIGNAGVAMEDGVEVIRLTSKRKYEYRSNVWEMMSWIRHAKKSAREYCEKNQPDIVFAHFALPGGEVARFLKKKTGIPYVIMSHGHDIPWFDPQQMFFYHLATYCRIKRIYNRSEALFLQSEFTKNNADRFSGKGKRNKNKVIPNGCDLSAFPPVKHEKSDVLRIFTSGRMVGQKEPFTLLRALPLLKKAGLPFYLTIAGDGPLLPSLKKFCSENELNDCVTFTGWLKKDDIPHHLQNSDVFVLPSRIEGMSISLLEALCSGVYSIVCPVSGNTDLVKEGINGCFFPVRNHQALADALIRFSEQYRNTYPVKEENVLRFREEFDWNRIAIQYETELKEILA